MNEIAATEVPTRDLWRSLPLELCVSVAAVILAGGLKLAGLLP